MGPCAIRGGRTMFPSLLDSKQIPLVTMSIFPYYQPCVKYLQLLSFDKAHSFSVSCRDVVISLKELEASFIPLRRELCGSFDYRNLRPNFYIGRLIIRN